MQQQSRSSAAGGSGLSIWQKLSPSSQHRLKEQGEMLQAAINLHVLLNTFSDAVGGGSSGAAGTTTADGTSSKEYISLRRQLVFAVMRDVVTTVRGDAHLLGEGLSVADIFFTKVSRIGDTLPSLDAQLATYVRLLPSSTDEQSAKHARTIAVRIVNSIFDVSRIWCFCLLVCSTHLFRALIFVLRYRR